MLYNKSQYRKNDKENNGYSKPFSGKDSKECKSYNSNNGQGPLYAYYDHSDPFPHRPGKEGIFHSGKDILVHRLTL